MRRSSCESRPRSSDLTSRRQYSRPCLDVKLGSPSGGSASSKRNDARASRAPEVTDSAQAKWENRYALDAEPETATRNVGQQHTVTATLTNDGPADAGETSAPRHGGQPRLGQRDAGRRRRCDVHLHGHDDRHGNDHRRIRPRR